MIEVPRGISCWITSEHMSFERIMNAAVSTFYRKPNGDVFEIWEIIHQEKFTNDMNKAVRDSVQALMTQIVKINEKKEYTYFDEDKRETAFQPFDGELEIKIGDDYQKIPMDVWKKEVEAWLNASP